MKRYMVFKGAVYYPSGGMEDFVASFAAAADAVREAKKLEHYGWSHVYDAKRHEIIARFCTNDAGEPDFDTLTWRDRYPWEEEDPAWIKENTWTP